MSGFHMFMILVVSTAMVLVCSAQPPMPGPPMPPGGSFPPGSMPPNDGGGGGSSGACTGNCGYNLTAKYKIVTNATHRVVYTNGIPNHSYYVQFPSGHVKNPNGVCEQFRSMTIPLKPVLAKTVTALSLGPVGILITGGFLYNHLDGPTSQTNDLALYREVSMDTCNGHPDQDCRYHYHKNPENCIANYSDCLLVGYLADGFPVYSFCTINGTRLKSCFSQYNGTGGLDTSDYFFNTTKVAAKDCHLDEANGYCFTDGKRGIASGSCSYGYVLSEDYPFVMPSSSGTIFYGMETLTSFPFDTTTAKPTTAKPTTAKPTTAKPTTSVKPPPTVAKR